MNKTDERVLEFIIEYKEKNDGLSPSFREIRDGVGAVSSTSHVSFVIDNLERDGKIEVEKERTRSIKVVGSRWERPFRFK